MMRKDWMQERIFLSPPHMGSQEQTLIDQVFQDNYIGPVGEMLGRFEQAVCEYTGFKHAVAVSSGTAAMHLALRHLGIGEGDVVLASTLTFIGSVSPVTFVGAELVFVDCEKDSWNMDPGLLGDELDRMSVAGRLPKAVIPTDLYGQCCNLPELVRVCERYGVPVICDSAEAMGAKYRKPETGNLNRSEAEKDQCKVTGSGVQRNVNPELGEHWVHAGYGAKAAVYSFNGNKIITTGGGGILASDDGDMIEHARKLATQSRDAALHYEHTEIGYNYRLSNVAAAIGMGQMQVLEERVAQRRQIFEWYHARLAGMDGVSFVPEPAWSRGNRWLTVILLDPAALKARPSDVIAVLERENIESRPVWKPMHMQPVFAERHCVGGAVSEELFSKGVCLPSGSALSRNDIERICEIFCSVK